MIPATPRGTMSQKRRQHIFSENCTGHNVAPCCICGKPVHRHEDKWIVEHKRALGLLGKDTNPNCAPAHVACASEKTHKEDLPRIRKAKRQAGAGTIRTDKSLIENNNSTEIRGNPVVGIAPETKKPARAFQVPAGVVYDWRQRRYVKKAV